MELNLDIWLKEYFTYNTIFVSIKGKEQTIFQDLSCCLQTIKPSETNLFYLFWLYSFLISATCVSVSHLSTRAGLLSTPVHCADSSVSSGQPQHRSSRQTLRGVWGPQQRSVEQVPERLQGVWKQDIIYWPLPANCRNYNNIILIFFHHTLTPLHLSQSSEFRG